MAYILIRTKVRDNLVSLLTGNTDAGSNVFSNREEPLFEEETEAINIYTRDGEPDQTRKFENEFKRNLQVFIEVLVRKTTQVTKPEDKAEIITGQIEDIILPNHFLQYPPPVNLQFGSPQTPGPIIVDEVQLGMTTEGKTPEGLTDVASLITELKIKYSYEIKVGSVETFNTGDIHYDLEGDQSVADQAHDRISITQ